MIVKQIAQSAIAVSFLFVSSLFFSACTQLNATTFSTIDLTNGDKIVGYVRNNELEIETSFATYSVATSEFLELRRNNPLEEPEAVFSMSLRDRSQVTGKLLSAIDFDLNLGPDITIEPDQIKQVSFN